MLQRQLQHKRKERKEAKCKNTIAKRHSHCKKPRPCAVKRVRSARESHAYYYYYYYYYLVLDYYCLVYYYYYYYYYSCH